MLGSGLVLQNNGGGDVVVNTNGSFTFVGAVQNGDKFDVTVKTQPSNPSQACTVTNGSGTVAGANVTDVAVKCGDTKFTIGGTVNGLVGTGLVLQNNGGDDLPISANGTFNFATSQANGSAFAVKVKTDPTNPLQTCLVAGGSGTIAGGNVVSVNVNCGDKKYVVSGKVSGLEGTGLVLQNNGGDDLPVNVNGDFAFAIPLANTASYNVTTLKNPTNKSQTCTVTNGSGKIAAADASVTVTCVTNKFTVGGTISGLLSGSVVLTNNGGSDLTVGSNGTFTFGGSLDSGAAYSVAVKTQPGDRDCVVTAGSGNVGNGPVDTVNVSCAHPGCRIVSGVLWCRDTSLARSCNTFCSSIGLGNPTISDADWSAAQDTIAECDQLSAAFGFDATATSLESTTYTCAEIRNATTFVCSTAPGCPASHRTGSDTGNHAAVCPCGAARACGTADEDQTMTLTCPAGTVVKSIDYASFGLPNGTCGSFSNAACNAQNSKSIVETNCLGKTSCSISASIDVFGDPCVNQNKRLYVQASCN
jgi:hypothetical protein